MASSALTIANQIQKNLKNTKGFFTDLTGADDPGTKAAARVLMRAIRKQLATKASVERRSFTGGGVRSEPSAPGEAPRSVTGQLRRSVGTEVVGGIRRVGPARFVGRLLEEGVDTTVQKTPSGRAFGKRKRKSGASRRTLRIAPRPFMGAALEEALPKMEGEMVSALQARDRTLRSYT